MPALSITQTYVTGNILTKTDLDNICTSLTTFMNSTKLDSTNVQTGGLVGTNLANATITATQLASSVAGSGLTGGAGTALAVNVDNSTLQVTTNTLSVKGNLTRPMLPTVGQQISASCGNFSTSATSYTPVTNLSVSITTTGRPVMLVMQSDGTAGSFGGAAMGQNSGTNLVSLAFNRGASIIGLHEVGSSGPSIYLPVLFLDVVAAGTYTYSVSIKSVTSGSAIVQNYVLAAYEL